MAPPKENIPANSPDAPPNIRGRDLDGNPISYLIEQPNPTVMRSAVSGNYTNPLAMLQQMMSRPRYMSDAMRATANANRLINSGISLTPDAGRTRGIDARRREMNLVTNRGRTEGQRKRDNIYRNQAIQRNSNKNELRELKKLDLLAASIERDLEQLEREAKQYYPAPPSNEDMLMGPTAPTPTAPTNEIPLEMMYVPPMEEDPELQRLGAIPTPVDPRSLYNDYIDKLNYESARRGNPLINLLGY